MHIAKKQNTLMNKYVYTYLRYFPYWLFSTCLNILLRSEDSNSPIANKKTTRYDEVNFKTKNIMYEISLLTCQ